MAVKSGKKIIAQKKGVKTVSKKKDNVWFIPSENVNKKDIPAINLKEVTIITTKGEEKLVKISSNITGPIKLVTDEYNHTAWIKDSSKASVKSKQIQKFGDKFGGLSD